MNQPVHAATGRAEKLRHEGQERLDTTSTITLRPETAAVRFLARTRRLRRVIGIVGVAAALPFFVWLPLGLVEAIPSMVDVYGIEGLRFPTSITISGLLLAAIGFFEA